MRRHWWPGSDPASAGGELAGLRIGSKLEAIGFYQWRGVHVVDLASPVLLDARMKLIENWWPSSGSAGPSERSDGGDWPLP